jgi:hypothetical protein
LKQNLYGFFPEIKTKGTQSITEYQFTLDFCPLEKINDFLWLQDLVEFFLLRNDLDLQNSSIFFVLSLREAEKYLTH